MDLRTPENIECFMVLHLNHLIPCNLLYTFVQIGIDLHSKKFMNDLVTMFL